MILAWSTRDLELMMIGDKKNMRDVVIVSSIQKFGEMFQTILFGVKSIVLKS